MSFQVLTTTVTDPKINAGVVTPLVVNFQPAEEKNI
jgi:hypothetical protein